MVPRTDSPARRRAKPSRVPLPPRLLLVTALLAASLSCGKEKPPTASDTTPPDAITDLAVARSGGTYSLTWTAPGDDGDEGQVHAYDIRYAAQDLLATWDTATQVPSPVNRVPGGFPQSVRLDSLGLGSWEFAVKAGDEAGNWSGVSNVATVTVYGDTIPPGRVTDLSAELVIGGIRLRWTAPGDDGSAGRATAYDLRYREEALDASTWEGATPVAGLSAPEPGGSAEEILLTDLELGTVYAFGVRAVDEAENWAHLSNVVAARVTETPPTQLTFNSSPMGAAWPTWHPGGEAVICHLGLDFVRQVFLVSLSGEEPIQYTFTGEGAWQPSWSTDGSKIVMGALRRQGNQVFSYVGVMEAIPGAVISNLGEHTDRGIGSTAWSPDGTRIAYRVIHFDAGRTTAEIYTMSADGSQRRLLAGPFHCRGISWSPDGTRIAFDSNQEETSHIWIIPSEGGQASRLTSGADGEYLPSWSPTGETIAFVSGGRIWGVPAEGGEIRELVNDQGVSDYYGLAWNPNGRFVAYTKVLGSQINVWVATVMH